MKKRTSNAALVAKHNALVAKRIATWDATPRVIHGNTIMERSATAEVRAGDFNNSRHVSVELAIGYGLGDREKGRGGVRIDVRCNSLSPNPKGEEPIWEQSGDAFGDWLDPRDLESFALALMEAVRLAKLDGVIQPWMVGEEPPTD